MNLARCVATTTRSQLCVVGPVHQRSDAFNPHPDVLHVAKDCTRLAEEANACWRARPRQQYAARFERYTPDEASYLVFDGGNHVPSAADQ